MATKRYDVGGRPLGGRRNYPEGAILKLTDAEAKAMGLTEKDVSKTTFTSDDRATADRYAEAMTSQNKMREAEAAQTEAATPADAEVANKKRTTR